MGIWNFSGGGEGADIELERFRENPPDVYGFGHMRYLQDVVGCLREGRPGAVDGREARRSLELIVAIYESIESNAEVKLPVMRQKTRLGRRVVLPAG